MSIEERLQAIEQELAELRRQRLQASLKELQDAMTVTAYSQARFERAQQQHQEWLENHRRAVARHDREMEEIREAGRRTDERIDKLVLAIGQLTARMGIPPQQP